MANGRRHSTDSNGRRKSPNLLMNAMKKSERRKLSKDGLLLDALEWTVDDWLDLHRAIDSAISKIRERHANRIDSVLDRQRPNLQR